MGTTYRDANPLDDENAIKPVVASYFFPCSQKWQSLHTGCLFGLRTGTVSPVPVPPLAQQSSRRVA